MRAQTIAMKATAYVPIPPAVLAVDAKKTGTSIQRTTSLVYATRESHAMTIISAQTTISATLMGCALENSKKAFRNPVAAATTKMYAQKTPAARKTAHAVICILSATIQMRVQTIHAIRQQDVYL